MNNLSWDETRHENGDKWKLWARAIIEQQRTCRIFPRINVNMLNRGGIASSGHRITFPQEINEPAKNLSRLLPEIQIIEVRKQGKDDTFKEFWVRRFKVEQSLKCIEKNISSNFSLHLFLFQCSICYHSPISIKKFKAYQSERENLQSSKYSSVKSAAQQEALENDIGFINNKIS